MARVLIYSQGTIGHGNMRRCLSVSNYLAEHHNDISVLLVTGSSMIHNFRISSKVDYVKLPALESFGVKDFRAKLQDLRRSEIFELRSNIISQAVLGFAPDVMLVDKNPEGIGGELIKTYEALRRIDNPPRKILMLRDILEDSETTIAHWQQSDYYKKVETHFDEIAVVGQRSIFDLTEEYDFPENLTAKTTFCGYLQGPMGKYDRCQMRKRLGLSTQPLVVVAAGGGADGKYIFSNYLHGIGKRPLPDGGRSVLFLGSEMSRTDAIELEKLAERYSNVEVHEFSSDLQSYFAAADLFVSMGGYNTVCEILSHDKPSIVIPRKFPFQEQLIRADRLGALGLINYIQPQNLTVDNLMDLVHQCLPPCDLTRPSDVIDMKGIHRIGDLVLRNVKTKYARTAKLSA